MAWSFSGTLLPEQTADRLVVGTGPVQPLPGRFAIAGLVDAHCHLTVAVDDDGPYLDGAGAETRLRALASTGVTLVRDVGGDRTVTLPLACSPPPERPQVLAAGRFLAPRGRYFPRMHEPVEASALVAAVRREVADGATWVKIIADFPLLDAANGVGEPAASYPLGVVAAAIEAAHHAGARVAAHTNTDVVSDLIRCGVDSVEHGLAVTEDDLRLLAARGGAWTPTLGATFAAVGRRAPQARGEVAERLRFLLPRAVELGVIVLSGSDLVGSVAEEVALLSAHGLAVEEAIAAATSAARSYLGVGPVGDLVSYDADPREVPDVLRHPTAVVIRGRRVR